MVQDNTHLAGLVIGKGNAAVVITSNWKERFLLVEDLAHTTSATDLTQSTLLIKRFFAASC